MMKGVLKASLESLRRPWAILVLSAALGCQVPAQGMFTVPALTELVPTGSSTVPTGGALSGDFTGDGFLDIVCGCAVNPGFTGLGLYMFPGDGQGGFQTPQYSTISEFPVPLDSADLDGDGDLDLVVLSASGMRAALNHGNGVFQEQVLIPGIPGQSVGIGTGGRAMRDIDANGSMDVIAVGPFGPQPYSTFGVKVYTYLGGAFFESYSMSTPLGVGLAAPGDFNGDGLVDIAFSATSGPYSSSNFFAADIWVLVQQAPLSFSQLGPFSIPLPSSACTGCTMNALWLRAGDTNGDGIEDLLITADIRLSSSLQGHAYAVFPGDPVMVLGPATTVAGPVYEGEPTLADFDLDNQVDLFVSSQGPPTPVLVHRILPPSGTPASLTVPDGAGASYFYFSEAVGDMDRDGDPDVVFVMPSQPSGSPLLPGLFIGTALNQTIRHPACALPGAPMSPAFTIGTPSPGNASFFLGLSSALPGAPVALGLSTGEGQLSSGACTIWLDLSPASLLLPSGPLGFMTANAAGLASLPVPVPNAANLVGQSLFGQWIALDPQGPFWLGGQSFSLTGSRKILIW